MATSSNSVQAKDLSREAPRSPRVRLGNYALMARMIDKGRASVAGTAGDYHFDCPLDKMLFGFKGVKGDQVKELLVAGKSDDEIRAWFDANGASKSAAEVQQWSDESERVTMHGHPEKGEWFDGECRRLGLDPAKASLFDMLEADDRASYKK